MAKTNLPKSLIKEKVTFSCTLSEGERWVCEFYGVVPSEPGRLWEHSNTFADTKEKESNVPKQVYRKKPELADTTGDIIFRTLSLRESAGCASSMGSSRLNLGSFGSTQTYRQVQRKKETNLPKQFLWVC